MFMEFLTRGGHYLIYCGDILHIVYSGVIKEIYEIFHEAFTQSKSAVARENKNHLVNNLAEMDPPLVDSVRLAHFEGLITEVTRAEARHRRDFLYQLPFALFPGCFEKNVFHLVMDICVLLNVLDVENVCFVAKTKFAQDLVGQDAYVVVSKGVRTLLFK
eukprot:TRINITY_DN654768_c0_g1_i1.p1 TRINITY_DN654768_c0_g1~~TRINITY_DN654768_c0_g1_i1.p1  ORF type:complete len:167 (+),score=32.99 TRINITY_DN654768_c0_g1_i1:22-501(+)